MEKCNNNVTIMQQKYNIFFNKNILIKKDFYSIKYICELLQNSSESQKKDMQRHISIKGGNEMGEYPSNEGVNEGANGAVKDITNIIKKVSANSTGDILGDNFGTGNTEGTTGYNNINENNIKGIEYDLSGTTSEGTGTEATTNTFKVAKTNLPVKVGFWTKVRNVLLSEIKVELTPYQQKVEDEINEFLHQEVTWQSFKNFLFQEVPITYKGKRIF